jgi:hypothetical protein
MITEICIKLLNVQQQAVQSKLKNEDQANKKFNGGNEPRKLDYLPTHSVE